jgi:uroporphyrinogen-III synthase
LKGGDAGLFGRLTEEVEALDALDIPYVVRPGVSALTAATTPNGLLLTRRGEASGFKVSTPRSSGAKEPQVFFMATRMAHEMLRDFPRDMPYAMVWDACGPYERVETGVCGDPHLGMDSVPGLLVVGFAGTPFRRRKVLVTCSDAVMPRAVCMLEDKGLSPIEWPMISLSLAENAQRRIEGAEQRYDAIVLTSPVAVRMFFSAWKGDRRRLSEFWTCGAGTDAELRKYGVSSDIMPESDFSADGLVERLKRECDRFKGKKVLRLRSAKAPRTVAAAIRRMGALVDDVVLYDNKPVSRDGIPLPDFDAVFFASTSGVESFIGRYGVKRLSGRDIFVIGEPTRNALPPRLRVKAHLMPLVNAWREG